MVVRPLVEVFLNKISVSEIHFYHGNACWEWQGYISKKGYGITSCKTPIGRKIHRFMYDYFFGDIDELLTIDHLCRNRACCNPQHLEQVPMKINTLRGMGPTAINKRKTCCINNHKFTPNNTFVYDDGRRSCIICLRKQQLERRIRDRIKIKKYKHEYYLKKNS